MFLWSRLPDPGIAASMSKTNLMVLAATGLLGVLLYVVLGLVAEVPVPTGMSPLRKSADMDSGPSADREHPPPEYEHFSGLLAEKGLDADKAIEQYRNWRFVRGFLGVDVQLGIGYDDAPARYFETLVDDVLAAAASDEEIGALQELAARSIDTDLPGSIDLYRRAATQGSTHAMLQIAWVMDAFGEVAQARASQDRGNGDPLHFLQQYSASGDLKLEAIAWVLAAIRDGGASVARPDVLGWIEASDALLFDRACEQSIDIMIKVGLSRRAAGRDPVSLDPPPVFMRPADLYDRLPCKNSVVPIEPLVEAEECVVSPVVNARGSARQLWICDAL